MFEKTTCLCAALLGLSLGSACKKHPAASPPVTTPDTATTSKGPPLSPAQEAALVAPITAALDTYQRQKNKVPSDLNELVTAGILQSLPPLPPGKKFYYDYITVTVSVGDAR